MELSVIFLSYTKSDGIFEMTKNAIDSLLKSESKEIKFEIIIVESNPLFHEKYQFDPQVKIIIPEVKFNFHQFLNIGIKEAKYNEVALCNNDVIFHPFWYSEILKIKKSNTEIRSFSPCELNENNQNLEFEMGYDVRTHIKGWCIVTDKETISKIGYLDEKFDFYYADDDYSMTMKKFNIKHARVFKSKVEHLAGQNTDLNKKENDLEFDSNVKLTGLPKYLFEDNYKWILKNKKLLDGHLKFHEKWGNRKMISIKNKVFKLLQNIKLGFLSYYLFWTKN